MAKGPKNKMTERTPVTARGFALLAAVAAAAAVEPGYLMLTQDEASEGIAAGHLIANTAIVEGDTAAVKLTEAGQAAFAAGEQPQGQAGTEAAKPAGKTVFKVTGGIPIPTLNKGGRQSSYPFDKLEVGDSFHVPKTADNEDPVNRLASSVTSARARWAVEEKDEAGAVVMETVKVQKYVRGDDGKIKIDAEGKRVKDGEPVEETKPKMVNTRDFLVGEVGSDDPEGEGARVWRTA